VNGDSIGLVFGPYECYVPMYVAESAGALLGQFYYDTETLYGICDDTADSLMNATDVLANIQNNISMGDTSLQINLMYQNPNSSLLLASSNPIWAIFLAYTSPCDTF